MQTLKTVCRACGREGTVEVDDFAASYFSEHETVYPWTCPDCKSKETAEQEEKEREKREEERRNFIEDELRQSGVPRRYRVKAPFVPFVANWMIEHAGENILVTGETGCGKSTSAGYLARRYIESMKTVKWRSLSDLLDQWRQSRRGEYPVTAAEFLGKLENADLLIIDEASGDKTTSSESTRECMFRLLEDVYNGNCRAAVILLGNFFRGSIAEVFGNEEAARRRLSDTFLSVRIDKRNSIVQNIRLS